MSIIAAILQLVARTRPYPASGSKDGADPTGPVPICYIWSHEPDLNAPEGFVAPVANVRNDLIGSASHREGLSFASTPVDSLQASFYS